VVEGSLSISYGGDPGDPLPRRGRLAARLATSGVLTFQLSERAANRLRRSIRRKRFVGLFATVRVADRYEQTDWRDRFFTLAAGP
jgi:hypothetical protein